MKKQPILLKPAFKPAASASSRTDPSPLIEPKPKPANLQKTGAANTPDYRTWEIAALIEEARSKASDPIRLALADSMLYLALHAKNALHTAYPAKSKGEKANR